jgi:short subunit dehydrogenase-like uncharacterized protein
LRRKCRDAARLAGDGELCEATLVLLAARGGVSGGTIASMRGLIDAVRADPELAHVLADPYSLSPDRAAEPDLGPQPDAFLARRLDDGSWVAPFLMASYNSRIVRRSNALTGFGYGLQLR